MQKFPSIERLTNDEINFITLVTSCMGTAIAIVVFVFLTFSTKDDVKASNEKIEKYYDHGFEMIDKRLDRIEDKIDKIKGDK